MDNNEIDETIVQNIQSSNNQNVNSAQCRQCNDHPKMNLKGNSGENCMQDKGDYPGQVYLDQLVLGMSGGEAGQHEQWSKATQGGSHQAQVHSDQMVLVMARQKGWTM